MQIMHFYSDILREIDIIKEQLKTINKAIERWYFGGSLSDKYGANTTIFQVDKLVKSRNELYDRLEMLERSKERIEKLMQEFDGLEYKIAYLRIVENMTHKEVADELGYSEQYIRRLWMNMKKQQTCNRKVESMML